MYGWVQIVHITLISVLPVGVFQQSSHLSLQKPVDPKQLGLPDYFEVIKKPMDLSLIKKKFEQKEYNQ